MILSDYVYRAHLRDNEVPTVINVPSGKTRMQFYANTGVLGAVLYARRGLANAEPPDTNEVNDGTASFPYHSMVPYEMAVAEGERYSFVTAGVAGTLFVAFD